MFWVFFMAAGLALVFTQLGAMSVLVTALKAALFVALIALAVLVAVILWRQTFRR